MDSRIHVTRRAAVAWLAAGLAAPTASSAADEIAGPVKIVNPYPGGLVDVAARALADQLAVTWKVPVVVESKPGANELLAADAVAKAAKDGRTLLIGTEATFANNPSLYARLPYNADTDLAPVTELFDIRFALVTRGDMPVKTARDFVELMKREGAAHTYASSGVGGPLHLAMEQFRRSAGFELVHVPYKTFAQMLQDMIGGRVDSTFVSVPTVLQFVNAGKLKLLAVTGSTRMKEAPDAPTLAELGLGGADYRTSIGIATTGGTPPAVVQRLHADIRAVLLSGTFADRVLKPNGLEAVGSDPNEFARATTARRANAQRLIKALDIRLD